jgi:hypothetical protein
MLFMLKLLKAVSRSKKAMLPRDMPSVLRAFLLGLKLIK